MIKETKYNGFSAVPADYECPDGDLSLSLGVIPEDGALKPILAPAVKFKLGEGEEIVFIHTTVSYTHYIIYNSSNYQLSYIDKSFHNRKDIERAYNIRHYNAVGNTLLVFTDNGTYYYFWKDGNYVSLGDHVPNIGVSFGLVGHPRLFSLSDESKKTFTISFNSIGKDALHNEFSEENKTKITEQVMAKVNKFIAQETVNKGRFCFPFFVRYALRLYDGSLVHHSAPILMNPSTKNCPVVYWKRVSGKNSYTDAELDIMLVAADLDYRILIDDEYSLLSKWTDIIKSIDVFISRPIYTFDQDGKCSSFADTDNFDTVFIGKLYADNLTESTTTPQEDKLLGQFKSKDFINYYTEWLYARIFKMYYSADRKYPSETLHLPEFSDNKVRESLESTSSFFKLCSLDIEEMMDNRLVRTPITIGDEYLQSLLNREVMNDDYLSHDQLYAQYSFAFNSRLNLSGIERKLYDGFPASAMLAYCNAYMNNGFVMSGWKRTNTLDISAESSSIGENWYVSVYIKENGEVYSVRSSDIYSIFGPLGLTWFCSKKITNTTFNDDGTVKKSEDYLSRPSWATYFYYPNANAFKMLITNGIGDAFLIDLKPHEFLNGAYALLDYDVERQKNFTSLPSCNHSPYDLVSVPNKIYTSEVDNPFYFPVLGINSVGTGEIKGICSAVKALSQGQFGQFPLYAFTTEGVWALEVSSTGTYSAKQPVTRDVCINSKSITQTDSAVLFATDRGIMQISGSTTQCLTDTIDTDSPFSLSSLPGFDFVLTKYNRQTPADDKLLMEKITVAPFRTFLANCRMIYDYTHQRIVVYNPNYSYAYVFSIDSRQWGMMRSDIQSNINSYPDALAMDTHGNLVDFSSSSADGSLALVVTRPFKFGQPDLHKTIDTIIQRGTFHTGHVSQLLYGSNNLYSWHVVWSSRDHFLRGFRGTPYKYFRLVLVCNLQKDERIYGFTTSYTPRLTNRPR